MISAKHFCFLSNYSDHSQIYLGLVQNISIESASVTVTELGNTQVWTVITFSRTEKFQIGPKFPCCSIENFLQHVFSYFANIQEAHHLMSIALEAFKMKAL